jgi:hypothetical protein
MFERLVFNNSGKFEGVWKRTGGEDEWSELGRKLLKRRMRAGSAGGC